MTTETPTNVSTRSAIFKNAKPKSKNIEFFGQTIELRQPSLADALNANNQADDNQQKAIALMVVNYAFMPGTNDKIFSEADVNSIMEMPFGADMTRVIDAVNEMSDITAEVKDQVKN